MRLVLELEASNWTDAATLLRGAAELVGCGYLKMEAKDTAEGSIRYEVMASDTKQAPDA